MATNCTSLGTDDVLFTIFTKVLVLSASVLVYTETAENIPAQPKYRYKS